MYKGKANKHLLMHQIKLTPGQYPANRNRYVSQNQYASKNHYVYARYLLCKELIESWRVAATDFFCLTDN